MLSLPYSLFYMFLVSFLMQYYFMSWVMTSSIENFTNSLGKFYLSAIMGLVMVFLEWLMMVPIHRKNPLFWLTLFFFFFSVLLFIYLYRNQVFIGDKEYLNDMIEHHSMAILTSEEILKKTKNPQVLNLANNIIEAQTKEIQEMKEILIGI